MTLSDHIIQEIVASTCLHSVVVQGSCTERLQHRYTDTIFQLTPHRGISVTAYYLVLSLDYLALQLIYKILLSININYVYPKCLSKLWPIHTQYFSRIVTFLEILFIYRCTRSVIL